MAETVTLDSTTHPPQLPDENPTGNDDEDMLDAPKSTKSSDSDSDSDSDSEDDAQQNLQIQALQTELLNNPSNYDAHVQYIKALRKQGDIEKLRQAREAMNTIFPLSSEMWQEWTKDETSLSSGPEALPAIEKLFEHGVSDYLSVALWCDYLSFVQEHDQSVRTRSVGGISKARNLFERALVAAGLHVTEGSRIWELYREFEQDVFLTIDETDADLREKQVQRIRNLFHRQLSVPLADLSSTLHTYKAWEAKQGADLDADSSNLDGLPPHVASSYQKALDMMNARTHLENQISCKVAPESERLQNFMAYLKFEQSLGDPSRIQILYERAITEFPISSELWLDYTHYMDKTLKTSSLVRVQSETASVAVGNWLSLLLKAADAEAARGQQGSASLRIEAFSTLRILVAKVGTTDALAFFLPGVVSQIGKVLHMSKTFISGAAGNAEALDQAIRSLAEFLMIVLDDNSNLPFLDPSLDDVKKEKSPVAFLEALRHLLSTMHDQNLSEAVDRGTLVLSSTERESVSPRNVNGSLRVIRTKDWIVDTSSHVDKLLCATYPHLCMHPSRKVRQGLLAAIQGLLLKTSCVLKGSRLILLENLCVLACDDSEEVSSASQLFFGYLLTSHGKRQVKDDVREVFNRLVKKLPKVVLGADESYAIAHAQKLLVLIYFSGPRLVADYLLQSPVRSAQFLDVLALCLSQNSVFAGSLEKNVVAKPSSSGFMHSLAEIRAIRAAGFDNLGSRENQNRRVHATESVKNEHQLPRMPPWFVYVGSQKLYRCLAGILRLVGLSLFADSRTEGSLSVIIDLPLENLRKLISEIRMKEYSEESWQSWYNRITSGQLVRQASTAVCVLNELIFGLSDQAIDDFTRMFRAYVMAPQENKKCQEDESQHCKIEQSAPEGSIWKICQVKGERNHLVDCIGSILHEYLSPEIWSLPVEHTAALQQSDCEDTNISSHFFNDNVMLHQVIIDGIGIFSMCLGEDFSSSGFLHTSLYMLLHNLSCSHFQIRSASDAVLRIVAAMHDYPTVGHLVIANSDYIIDSICRQLRSLELNPDVPNVLAAMLSYIGVAHSIFPLLEEPMRAVSMELEILGRHQNPGLTIPFLKAMAEIVKASKHEASALVDQAKSYYEDVESRKLNLQKGTEKIFDDSGSYNDDKVGKKSSESGMRIYANDVHTQMEWETMLFKMSDFRRFRRTVGSIAGSCLTAATPLLASAKQAASLVALDIVDDGFLTVANVEDAYKHEKEIKEAIEHVAEMCSFYSLKDALDADADESTENRLLPAANKVWPFLVACIRNKSPLAVRRCAHTISNIVQICGGDFFTRRFHTDGKHFWSLLSTSPFQKRAPHLEEAHLRLPYRGDSASSGDPVAEISDLKVQAAVLSMLADLARNKHSASALEAVLKKVSGLVVGIACSGVVGLRDASVNALAGLASVDPDLIWLLLADVYYSKKRETPMPPTTVEFLEIPQILPPPLSSKGYLYLQYGGNSYGFDIDFTSVETVFRTLHSQVFSSQMYS